MIYDENHEPEKSAAGEIGVAWIVALCMISLLLLTTSLAELWVPAPRFSQLAKQHYSGAQRCSAGPAGQRQPAHAANSALRRTCKISRQQAHERKLRHRRS